MKYILTIIISCALISGCGNKDIGMIGLSDKDGCLVVFKLKKEAQHICVIEACLMKTEIKLPGNPTIKISDFIKDCGTASAKKEFANIKTPKLYSPPGWKLQFNKADGWRVLKPSGQVLFGHGVYGRNEFESKQEAIDAAWEVVEFESQYKKENTWHDHKEDIISPLLKK